MLKTEISKIIVGKFGRVHGVQGWLKVHSFTEPPDNILQYSPWWVELNHTRISIPRVDYQWHHEKLLVKLPQVNDREQAKLYTNAEIAIDKMQLPKLAEDEFYWCDLAGLIVINLQNQQLGVVDHLLATGANDVLVVKGEKDYLIPYIFSRYVKKVCLKTKQIVVDWDPEF